MIPAATRTRIEEQAQEDIARLARVVPGSTEHRVLHALLLADGNPTALELIERVGLPADWTGDKLLHRVLLPLQAAMLARRCAVHRWCCTLAGRIVSRSLGDPGLLAQHPAFEGPHSMFRRAMGNGDQRSPMHRPGSLDAGRLPSLICGRRVWPGE